ncbi:MAG: amino acid ABC transporter permease [Micrococcales bacterium]|uniref:amino acid ABC transporter permease n=1 Tax=Microbacterium sp. 67-17 TaxID=1895782 RepID=UPI000A485601|nr:amino acid ABC transporter permease [Microbacterium sp. 67-17]MBD3751702.1 amino acid ABC transporter permease [Micrococcales bacterium]
MSDKTVTSPPEVPPPTSRPVKLNVVPVRHYGRGIGATIVVLLLLGLIYSFATNPSFNWAVVAEYLLNPNVLRGLGVTLVMTVIGMVLALVLAVVIGVMYMAESRVMRWFAAGWVFVFRGIPLIVLLIFLGNLGLFFKRIVIPNPFLGGNFVDVATADVVSPFVASVLGLALAGSGYMAEIVRSGLLAVGRGQREAAKALGMRSGMTLQFIVLPQALRIIVPPLGNEFIGMLKASAIVSVIAGGDLLTVVLGLSGINFRTIEMLIVATIWYLLVIAVFSVAQFFLERKVAER